MVRHFDQCVSVSVWGLVLNVHSIFVKSTLNGSFVPHSVVEHALCCSDCARCPACGRKGWFYIPTARASWRLATFYELYGAPTQLTMTVAGKQPCCSLSVCLPWSRRLKLVTAPTVHDAHSAAARDGSTYPPPGHLGYPPHLWQGSSTMCAAFDDELGLLFVLVLPRTGPC